MHHRRTMAVGVLCVATAALIVTSAGTSTALPSQPTTPLDIATVAAPQCAAKAGSEWSRCLSISARFDHAPAVGADAGLSVDVTSQVDLDRV